MLALYQMVDPRPTVSSLNAGDEFQIDLGPNDPPLKYRLIYSNQCRAYVEPIGAKRHNIITRQDGTTAEWDSPRGRVNISPGTLVDAILRRASEDTTMDDLIDGGMDDLLGLSSEDNMDDLLGELPKARGKKRAPKTTDGKRELDPSTKRGQVVALFRSGKTAEQVCDKLGIKRSCAFSHLSDARKYNGVEYEVSGGKVRIK